MALPPTAQTFHTCAELTFFTVSLFTMRHLVDLVLVDHPSRAIWVTVSKALQYRGELFARIYAAYVQGGCAQHCP